MTNLTHPHYDRTCGKGWQGEIGDCKRAKAKGAAVHGSEMVAAWAGGKLAGSALTQVAVAHGGPHEVAKIVSESSMQALAAVAIHAATHSSKPRKLASVFVTQVAAAAAGKISHGEGVERVFQTHSNMIGGITVKRRGDVRRAKLYYLRGLTGKKARIKEKI